MLSVLLKSYRVAVIDDNLRRSFPDNSPREIKLLRQSYQKHLSHIIAESLKGFDIPQVELAKRFEFLNPELANAYFDEGQSIILVLGHIGNWEWGQAVVSHYLKHKCVGVYKPISNNSLDEYILKKRSRYNVKLLPQKQLLKYLINHRDETNAYIFIADQYPPAEPRAKIEFLNRPTYFDTSVEKIAKKYKLPVIYANISKVSDAQYKTELIELCSKPGQVKEGTITQRYSELLAENILEAPELWLWSHRRWK